MLLEGAVSRSALRQAACYDSEDWRSYGTFTRRGWRDVRVVDCVLTGPHCGPKGGHARVLGDHRVTVGSLSVYYVTIHILF